MKRGWKMRRLHFVGGEKGGVGKSVVARLLCQYWIDQSVKFAAFDGDTSHGALRRYYTGYSTPIDLNSEEDADRILERVIEEEELRVLVDLPAQCAIPLHRWLDRAEVLEVAHENSVAVTFWHVTDGGFDSVQVLDTEVSKLEKRV